MTDAPDTPDTIHEQLLALAGGDESLSRKVDTAGLILTLLLLVMLYLMVFKPGF